MTKEEKSREAKIRRTIVKVGREFNAKGIEYLEKNSNLTNEQAISMIAKMHIKNDLIRSNFLKSVNRQISKV